MQARKPNGGSPLDDAYPTTIYMPLLDQAFEAWSPVGAQHLGGSRYRVVGRPPSDERWRFSTGAIVICEERMFGGAKSLIALNLAA